MLHCFDNSQPDCIVETNSWIHIHYKGYLLGTYTLQRIPARGHKEKESRAMGGCKSTANDPHFGRALAAREPDIPEEVREFNFDFENLALEGGGTKTYAYLGALKVLEDLGMLQKFKRFAGASGGAIVSTMLAIGYDVRALHDFYSIDLNHLAADATWGWLALLPNLLKTFGWHPGIRVDNLFRRMIGEKTGNPDITFDELYKQTGKELCICASNVSRMTIEYYHPKTTPDVPIALALRMSISIPGFYQPVRVERDGCVDIYVDGGMLCNYPLFVYDGWYLSMDPNDAFLHKLGTDEPPFGKINKKTVGMLVYATEDAEMLRTNFQNRYRGHDINRPDTRLARERGKQCDRQLLQLEQRDNILNAATSFWTALQDSDINRDGAISLDEFQMAVKKVSTDHLKLLFGKDFADEKDFSLMDENGDGEVSYNEFVRFMDRKGLAFREAIEGSATPRKLKNFADFSAALLDTMEMTIKKFTLKRSDAYRTIGVHTDYIQTTDFDLEDADKEYITIKSEVATIEYLREYVHRSKEGEDKLIMGSVISMGSQR